MGLIILYFLGALSMSFLCSVLEAVLLSTPMSFITMKESQGNKTASLMKDYKDNVDRPVGAILSLNTIAHTIGSAGVGAESIKLFGEEYFGIVFIVFHPENHRGVLLALTRNAVHENHTDIDCHHLSACAAFRTHNEGVYAQGQTKLYEPRRSICNG